MTYVASVRIQAMERLVALIAAEVTAGTPDPDNVQVLDHDPGGMQRIEAIHVVDVRGDRPADRLSGGADMFTSDDFTVTLVGVARRGKMTAAQARQRADEFYQAISRVVCSAQYEKTLGDFQTADGHHPIVLTEFGRVDGPISDPSSDKGFFGWVRVDVRIVTNEVSP